MLRVALRHGVMDGDPAQSPEERHQAALALLQSAPDTELYDIRWIDAAPPTRHRTLTPVQCSRCGEDVAEDHAELVDGRPVCPECMADMRQATIRGATADDI